MSESRGQWISTTDAAARLGVHPRAIQKRAARGSIAARKVGNQWEIDVDASIGPKVDAMDASNGRIADAVDAKHVQSVDASIASTGLNGRVHMDAVDASIIATGRGDVEVELRAQLAREREFSAILKTQLEAVTQSEAQTKAALREVLRVMPKQLSAGAVADSGREQSGTNSHGDATAPDGATGAGESPTYDEIADEIERRLNQ